MTENSAYGSGILLSAAVFVRRDRFYARQERQQEQRGSRPKALLIFGNANPEAVHYGMVKLHSSCSQTQEEVKDLSAERSTERELIGV